MVLELKIPQTDFTARDFESIMLDFLGLIPFFNPEWTDFNPSDLGITLLELFAAMGDGLHFQVDRALNESFIETAIKRESVVNLLKLIDYDVPGPAAATVELTFSIDSPLASDLTIDLFTEVQTEGIVDTDVVFFETSDVATILMGETEVTGVPAIEGKTSFENLDPSNETAFQTRLLTPTNIIEDTLSIVIDEGAGFQLWAEIENIALGEPDERVYETLRLPNGQIEIRFGDGGSGKIPSADALIRADFRLGGGLRGNIGATSINQVNSQILFEGSPITVAVNNPADATGGADEMSIAVAKLLGPLTVRANERAVSQQDYQVLAQTIVGVAKALARKEGPGDVRLAIAPDGGGVPSTVLKDQVLEEISAIMPFTFELTVEDPKFVKIELNADITVFDNFTNDETKTEVENNLLNFFDFDSSAEIEFGNNINFSDIVALVDNSSGVDFVDFTKMTIIPEATLEVWTGDSTFSTIVVSSTTVRETWLIQFTSPTTFTATGSVSGVQVATGTVDVLYTSDNGEVSFTIVSGASPQALGDRASFRTSVLLGNITINDDELAQLVLDIDADFTFTGGQ